MPPRIVTLAWNPNAVKPEDSFAADPPSLPVSPAGVIHFQLHPDTLAKIPCSRLPITLDSPSHFAAPQLQHGPGENGAHPLQLTVNPIPHTEFAAIQAAFSNTAHKQPLSHYQCELPDPSGATLAWRWKSLLEARNAGHWAALQNPAGNSASNAILSPLTGCSNRRYCACRKYPPSPGSPGRFASGCPPAPYNGSPTSGCPIDAR